MKSSVPVSPNLMSNGVVMATGLDGHISVSIPAAPPASHTPTSSTSTVAQPSHADPTSKFLGQDLSSVCGCSNCTARTFLSIGCPRPSQVPTFSLPFADLSHLKDTQKVITLGRLYLEYQYIVSLFVKLKKEIFNTITSTKITSQHLSKVLVRLESFMPSLPQDEKSAEVKKAKSLVKLFAMLPDDSSFLEYHVFEDLVSHLKLDKSSSVKGYKQELEQFCRRSIFECPLFSQAGKKGHSNFIVEMGHGRMHMSIQELVSVQDQLCSVLSVVTNTLNLCNVSKLPSGSMQVIFRVSNVVKEVLLPLNQDNQASLRQLGCLDWSFYNGLDISYNPAQLANQLLSSGRIEESNHTAGHTSNAPDMQKMDDLSSEDEDDDDSPSRKKLKPAPGKKTRGRVKIPMEYIKNKLRRYTTFSKRKSNIMKKAYELSTLTGTQVMLMVASETGHVYTFATPKLQPMITSEAGKALIQTCLHQPDPVQHNSSDHMTSRTRGRMSSSGYEETDLGAYAPPTEDEHKNPVQDLVPPTSSLYSSSILAHGGGGSSSSSGGGMLSMYSHPPLSNDLLPGSILHSLVSTTSSSLLPPPLISPDGYSSGPPEEDDLEPPRDGKLD